MIFDVFCVKKGSSEERKLRRELIMRGRYTPFVMGKSEKISLFESLHPISIRSARLKKKRLLKRKA